MDQAVPGAECCFAPPRPKTLLRRPELGGSPLRSGCVCAAGMPVQPPGQRRRPPRLVGAGKLKSFPHTIEMSVESCKRRRPLKGDAVAEAIVWRRLMPSLFVARQQLSSNRGEPAGRELIARGDFAKRQRCVCWSKAVMNAAVFGRKRFPLDIRWARAQS